MPSGATKKEQTGEKGKEIVSPMQLMTKNNLDELEMRGVDIGYTSTASSSHADISHDALLAAYDLVEKMVGFANDFKGAAPLWHGWALREAFLAGALYEQNKQKTASTQKNV